MDAVNQNNISELEEMRKQFAILQEKLDKQVDINDKQMRKALSQGIGQMKNRDRQAVVVCLVGWVFVALAIYFMKLSVPFQIFTDVAMGVNFYCSLKYKLHVNDFRTDRLANSDLVQTTQELLKYKRFNQNYLKYVAIPFVVVFVSWYSYEILVQTGATTLRDYIFIIVPLLVGACVGGIFGYTKFYHPAVRQADDMLRQIEELQAL